ncbi:cobyric acid synthase [Pendulispora albinea]|uniref:Cobyric acid synthase n=1 Tax=Pendulispora albinea TaxID=2741071 RepID=A0ABZ2M267_9BACT
MTARTIMVQGTASSVGKSIVCAALCRLFRQDGLRVAPFKSQNMALNAFVTPDGGEIGRAQAVQAEAARVVPTVDMNPILLKPEGDARSQVVVLGKSIGSLGAADYHTRKPELRTLVREALDRLRASHDLVVIEGAGSPAEINLKERDIVNMYVAQIADAPVVLVGDIDRGGVFAAFVGTMELLEPHERARVAAFVVNKFRGDIRLLEPGLRFLEERTRVPVLGVLPYVKQLRVADEDSVSLEERRGRRRAKADEIEIAVVRLPRISNYDDFQPLEHEPGVVVRFVEHEGAIAGADLVVVPGTKSTMADLAWLRQSGLAAAIVARARRGEPVLGICGGCQILGETIADPHGVESPETFAEGLGLLAFHTQFGREKRTSQVRARGARATFLCDPDAPAGPSGGDLFGYEIHMGRLARLPHASGAFAVVARNGVADRDLDGDASGDGAVVGTMIHGLFENIEVRRTLLAHLRRRKGLPPPPPGTAVPSASDEYDRLADVVRNNVNMDLLRRLVQP